MVSMGLCNWLRRGFFAVSFYLGLRILNLVLLDPFFEEIYEYLGHEDLENGIMSVSTLLNHVIEEPFPVTYLLHGV